MHALSFRAPSARRGFTLVEVLVATVLVLIMLATVVSVFASMSDSMSDSRSMIEVNDRVRYTKDRLQLDLAGVTVPMLPPRRPESGEGYFEYIEGPIGPITAPPLVALDADGVVDDLDTTVGDIDDILMFTTRSSGEPFVGRAGTTTVQSQVAEVCWFLRGTTLYRRQLLVAPGLETTLPAGWNNTNGFYARFDLSARQVGGSDDWRTGGSTTGTLRLNTLGDLTKRENRFAHQPWSYPHDARFWGTLGLPTLRECSAIEDASATPPQYFWPLPLCDLDPDGIDREAWVIGSQTTQLIVPNLTLGNLEDSISTVPNPRSAQLTGTFDAWTTPFPWTETDPVTGTRVNFSNGARIADDVILTNVISFDVKAWDPGAPVFAIVDAADAIPRQAKQIIAPSGEYPEHRYYKYNTATAGPLRPFFAQANLASVPVNDFDATPPDAARPISFGAYVDLNYMGAAGATLNYPQNDFPTDLPRSDFFGPGQNIFLLGPNSTAATGLTNAAPAVYDTWSTHYEHDGFDQDDDGAVDEGSNGFDDNGQGGVDDVTEKEAPPPYPVPLRGIQVKIRVFEPGTRQIREVTVVQDFVAQ